jgi:hypothetical protein
MNYLSAGSAGYSPPKMGNLRLPTRVASHWPSAGTPVNCRARNLASTIETLLDQKLLASAGFWGWQLMATQQFVEVETIQRIWDGKKKTITINSLDIIAPPDSSWSKLVNPSQRPIINCLILAREDQSPFAEDALRDINICPIKNVKNMECFCGQSGPWLLFWLNSSV